MYYDDAIIFEPGLNGVDTIKRENYYPLSG